MKPLIPTCCLAAGIAIGWFAHPPASIPAAVVTAPAKPPAAEPVPAKAAVHDTVVEVGGKSGRKVKAPRELSEADKKAGEAQMKKAGKMMADMQRKKFEARFARVAAELNLTPAQQEQVRASMEERFKAVEGMYDHLGEGGSSANMVDLMKSDGVEEALAGALTDEQKAGYTAFKGKERQARVENTALRNLASVSSDLELTPEQKDGVYQVLSEQAATREDAPKPAGFDAGAMMEGMGIRMDDELGFGGMLGLMAAQAEAHGAEVMAAAREGREAVHSSAAETRNTMIKTRIDSMVDSMRPHLTEAQLQQYRAHLENKAASLTSMMGFGDGDDGK